MFAACPHCHFLIALHPQNRAVPATCPRCGKQVDDGSPVSAETATGETGETGEAMPSIGSSATQALPDAELTSTGAAMHKPDVETQDAQGGTDGTSTAAQEKISVPSPEADPDIGDADVTVVHEMTEADAAMTARGKPPSTRPAHAKTDTPNFTRAARVTAVQARIPKWQWITLIALSLLLAIQTLLADRARLAADAGWRPFVAQLCGVFRCSIPVWRQPEAFTMLSRDVRPVSGSPGTLQAQATFRNDARWAQAWPIVLLTLKDADGRTLGARALTPSEYLDAGQVQSEIAPGQSAQIAVRIREPSANVVAFSFDFR